MISLTFGVRWWFIYLFLFIILSVIFLTHRKCHRQLVHLFLLGGFLQELWKRVGMKLKFHRTKSSMKNHVLHDYVPNLDWQTCNHGLRKDAAIRGSSLLYFFFSLQMYAWNLFVWNLFVFMTCFFNSIKIPLFLLLFFWSKMTLLPRIIKSLKWRQVYLAEILSFKMFGYL